MSKAKSNSIAVILAIAFSILIAINAFLVTYIILNQNTAPEEIVETQTEEAENKTVATSEKTTSEQEETETLEDIDKPKDAEETEEEPEESESKTVEIAQGILLNIPNACTSDSAAGSTYYDCGIDDEQEWDFKTGKIAQGGVRSVEIKQADTNWSGWEEMITSMKLTETPKLPYHIIISTNK